MALTIVGIQDCRASLGPSQALRGYQVQPGVSDYPSSGYPIMAASVDLDYLYGAVVIASNAAAALYTPKFIQSGIVAGATVGSNPAPAPSTSLLMEVVAADVQVSVGTNLNTCAWYVEFLGF
jgi:hypothetical protein